MGTKKIEQKSILEENREIGKEAGELMAEKVEDAHETDAAMKRMEAVDDDDKDALELAREESEDTAKEIAENQARRPAAEIGERLNEVTDRTSDFAGAEERDAQSTSDMAGDYAGHGAKLRDRFEESAEEFRAIAEQSDRANDEIQAELDSEAKDLESTF